MKECIICNKELEGAQTLFCSNACKQADKYARKMGRRCAKCHQPIAKPIPVMGGFSQQCTRRKCLNAK